MGRLKVGISALIGLGVITGVPSAWAFARSARRIRTLSDVPETEVGLVLGAGIRWDGTPSLILQGRLNVAKELYDAGKIKRIIVSGSPESRGFSEPVVMRYHLLSHGVPADAIVLDESGVDTWRSCRRAAGEFGLRELTVISSQFHLRRAVAMCRRLGVDAHGVGHDAAADRRLERVAARGVRREFLATVKAFWYSR
ncbi:YdcF family protein [Saccharopolyspora sp. WRP15-2]|uniref:YdcF family protein n=1 Tax=Saccharopolyspora oryzae TaxID=2997343 RepID=A0ABT4UU80_9PSEU|nr:ElyC/SanA/YdcF family protein [Saccharopolyspora oryzae]MDA3625113.1 YdcF family protein [Saccharopolyspora oryzae]